MSTYENNKKEGLREEERFAELLAKTGFTNIRISPDADLPWFDIIATSPAGKTMTFEVKKDYLVSATGNYAVELYGLRKNGNIKPAGLSASIADFFVYTNTTSNNFFITTTQQLKQIWKEEKYDREVKSGEGNAVCMLIKKNDFESLCKVVNPKN